MSMTCRCGDMFEAYGVTICDNASDLRTGAANMVGGGVLWMLAVIFLLVHWTKYSKSWEHATYGRAKLVDEGVELQRP